MMIYCFFKRCYDDEEQFMQCLHFARRLFDVSPQGLSDQKEALVAECMPNVWWGCGEDDDLRAFLAKVERRMRLRLLLAANEGQNRFGEVAGPFLAFPAAVPQGLFRLQRLPLCVQEADGAGQGVLLAGPRVRRADELRRCGRGYAGGGGAAALPTVGFFPVGLPVGGASCA